MISATSIVIQFSSLATHVASELPWAEPQLQNNALVVILVIIFSAIDLLACHPKGMLIHQLAWLGDTRNARTFEGSSVVYPWLKPFLVAQLFIFTSLCLFCLYDDAPALHLASPTIDTWILLGFCLAAPVLLFALQLLCYNWFCYLFRAKFQQIIMNRIFLATLILLSPFTIIIFIGTMAGSFSDETTGILLGGLFILSQILFIFNGFRIFLKSFESLLIIIVYLCTLEIAPLWVIWAKFST